MEAGGLLETRAVLVLRHEHVMLCLLSKISALVEVLIQQCKNSEIAFKILLKPGVWDLFLNTNKCVLTSIPGKRSSHNAD